MEGRIEREKNKGKERKERNIKCIKETGGEGRGGKRMDARRQQGKEKRKESEGKKGGKERVKRQGDR